MRKRNDTDLQFDRDETTIALKRTRKQSEFFYALYGQPPILNHVTIIRHVRHLRLCFGFISASVGNNNIVGLAWLAFATPRVCVSVVVVALLIVSEL